MRKKQKPVDRIFLALLLILVLFGLLMVFSASMYSSVVESGGTGFSQFLRQAFYVLIGLAIMAWLSRQNYQMLDRLKFSRILYFSALVLLVIVWAFGKDVNGAKRWIAIGPITFQPSEWAKFAGIVYIAVVMTHRPQAKSDFLSFLGYCFLPTVVLCGLAAIEPSLSAALAIAMAMFFAMYFGKVRIRYFIFLLAAVAAAAAVFLIIFPWRMERFNVFRGQGGQDYQIMQSLLAIGSGGIFGRGLGAGRQKLLYLPELQNDFIFANIGEETGLFGCLLLLVLFAAFILRGFKIARSAKDEFGYVYTSSVIALIAFQVIVNICVASGIMPVTGIALPFVSAGGTSEIILLGMMGPILNLSRGNEQPQRKRRPPNKKRSDARMKKRRGQTT